MTDPSEHRVTPARFEQAFELAMALSVGLASPVAAVVTLLAVSSAAVDVDAVGERLVRWSGAGMGGSQGHGAAVVMLPASDESAPDEPVETAAGEDDPEPEPPEEPSAVAEAGPVGPEAGPVELGGGAEDALAAPTTAAPVHELIGSKHPGAGQPWGTVAHGTGRLHGGGGGGGAEASGSLDRRSGDANPQGPPGPPSTHVVDAAGGMRFVALGGGEFWMGSPDDEPGRFPNEGPRHHVSLSPYWLAATEVTRAQYKAVMGSAPRGSRGEHVPVVGVSWCDALRFANALSKREGLRPAYRMRGVCGHGGTVSWDRGADGYRLPTEAEWEHAARAGTEGLYAGARPLDEVGWFEDNAGGRARAVASLAPNAYGLHDMSGNVWEWVWDRLGPYDTDPKVDPVGPDRGETRILRGGSWKYEARYARVADRNWGRPGYRAPAVGFRLARSLRPGDLDALVSEE